MRNQDSQTVHVGMVVNKTTWDVIRRLAKKYRVSSAFVVERALAQVAESGSIYWPKPTEVKEAA